MDSEAAALILRLKAENEEKRVALDAIRRGVDLWARNVKVMIDMALEGVTPDEDDEKEGA